MKHRSQLISIYQSFAKMIHTQFSSSIRVFRSDSGGEYLSSAFRQFLSSEGTLPQLSCPDAHAQNCGAPCHYPLESEQKTRMEKENCV